MWAWLRSGKNKQEPAETGLRQQLESIERDLKKMRHRLDEIEVDMEHFVAKVATAAKRAYKREFDAEKGEAKAIAASPELTRAAAKAALRARFQTRASGE